MSTDCAFVYNFFRAVYYTGYCKTFAQGMACNVTGWRSADNSDPSRPATEVDYLVKVQVIDLPIAFRLPEQKQKQ